VRVSQVEPRLFAPQRLQGPNRLRERLLMMVASEDAMEHNSAEGNEERGSIQLALIEAPKDRGRDQTLRAAWPRLRACSYFGDSCRATRASADRPVILSPESGAHPRTSISPRRPRATGHYVGKSAAFLGVPQVDRQVVKKKVLLESRDLTQGGGIGCFYRNVIC
jgi:hypothetical protein